MSVKKKVSIENRRQILKKGASIIGVSVCGKVLPILLSGCETDTLKSTGNTEEFNVYSLSIGDAIKYTFGVNNNGRPVIIIRHSVTEFTVLTSVCTHRGCEVNLPKEPKSDIVCPCHGSVYSSSTGMVKKGPAQAPLQKFNAVFDPEKNILRITF